jgi:diacylglycerol diphosphate phosphatase / phosphatidate phosphatase
MFRLDYRAIQYPHAEIERVSSLENVLIAGIGPLATLVIWAIVGRPGVHKAHVTILGLVVSVYLTLLLTDVIKNAIGRPRPDLIDRCKPAFGTPEHDLITIDVCTAKKDHTLRDGWRSFPSGHSSWAFSGLGYFSLFLAGQLRVFRPHADLARSLIFLAPLGAAMLIAISRLTDYRHDVYDVTCGSTLGFIIAFTTYRRYYPALWYRRCDVPFPSHLNSELAGAIRVKGRDIEEQLAPEEFELSLSDHSDDESRVHLLPTGRPPAQERALDTSLGTAEPP